MEVNFMSVSYGSYMNGSAFRYAYVFPALIRLMLSIIETFYEVYHYKEAKSIHEDDCCIIISWHGIFESIEEALTKHRKEAEI